VERIGTDLVHTRARHEGYFVTQTVVFTKVHFHVKLLERNTERLLAFIGVQKVAELDKVRDLWVVWFG